MKKFFLCILPLSLTFSCGPKIYDYNDIINNKRIKRKNYYIKDRQNYNDAVLGTWRWEEGDGFFELTLKEFEKYKWPKFSNRYGDDIYGKYTFVRKGELIHEVAEITPLPKYSVLVSFWKKEIFNIIVVDHISETHRKGVLNIHQGESLVTAHMKLRESHDIFRDRGNGKPWALPMELTLTKIKDSVQGQ